MSGPSYGRQLASDQEGGELSKVNEKRPLSPETPSVHTWSPWF